MHQLLVFIDALPNSGRQICQPGMVCASLLAVDSPAKISLALLNFGFDPSAGQITGARPKFGSALQGQKPNEP